jgi:hypothetical protein
VGLISKCLVRQHCSPHAKGVDIALGAFGVGKGSAEMADEEVRKIEITYSTAFASAPNGHCREIERKSSSVLRARRSASNGVFATQRQGGSAQRATIDHGSGLKYSIRNAGAATATVSMKFSGHDAAILRLFRGLFQESGERDHRRTALPKWVRSTPHPLPLLRQSGVD